MSPVSGEELLQSLGRIKANLAGLPMNKATYEQSERDVNLIENYVKIMFEIPDEKLFRDFVVVFFERTARIYFHPNEVEELAKLPSAVKNPDLSRVRGVPPHLWALVKGKIVPIRGKAASLREAEIRKRGAGDTTHPLKKPKKKSLLQRLKFWS